MQVNCFHIFWLTYCFLKTNCTVFTWSRFFSSKGGKKWTLNRFFPFWVIEDQSHLIKRYAELREIKIIPAVFQIWVEDLHYVFVTVIWFVLMRLVVTPAVLQAVLILCCHVFPFLNLSCFRSWRSMVRTLRTSPSPKLQTSYEITHTSPSQLKPTSLVSTFGCTPVFDILSRAVRDGRKPTKPWKIK